MAILTFGQLQKAHKLMFEGSGITVLQATTPTPSSDLPTTTWDVLTIPQKSSGTTRHASSQNSSADPQQQAQE